MDICGPGGDWRENSWHPGQTFCGQDYGRKLERMPSWRRGKSGHMKNLYSIMQENYEEFILLTLRTRSWTKPSGMLARNWKHQSLPLCLPRSARTIRIVGMVINPIRSKSKLACILEASESTRLRMGESLPNHHEDHIAGKGDNSLQHYNLVHKFIPVPQAMKIPAAKAAVDKEWEQLEKIRRGTWRIGYKAPKIERSSCIPRRHC